MASNADTPRARALGAELRQARERVGLSQRGLAAKIGRASSHVNRWENGRLIPSEADTAQVLQVLDVQGAERSRLLELARDALDPDWLAPGVDRQLAALTEYERTAERIVNVEPMLIPGLMQTYDYARHVMMAFGDTTGTAAERAQARVGRQHVLTYSSAPRVTAIIGEYAMRHPLCPDEVMVEQLQHLLKVSALDNVDLQIMPFARPVAAMLAGPWTFIEFAKTKPVVHLEQYKSSATITEEKTVAGYRDAVDTLCRSAMSPAESMQLIADAIEQKETQP
ncbi:helix-turn-helix domain-containing protein [Saccharomonospora azurea]